LSEVREASRAFVRRIRADTGAAGFGSTLEKTGTTLAVFPAKSYGFFPGVFGEGGPAGRMAPWLANARSRWFGFGVEWGEAQKVDAGDRGRIGKASDEPAMRWMPPVERVRIT
jgi:hypothetical protein